MEITQETAIKELIPEGWRLNNVSEPSINGDEATVVISMSVIKDMEWYIREYSKHRNSMYEYEVVSDVTRSALLNKNYEIPIENKIGLLKFICDDLGVRITRVLSDIEALNLDITPSFQLTSEIIKITGEDFVNSINLIPA